MATEGYGASTLAVVDVGATQAVHDLTIHLVLRTPNAEVPELFRVQDSSRAAPATVLNP